MTKCLGINRPLLDLIFLTKKLTLNLMHWRQYQLLILLRNKREIKQQQNIFLKQYSLGTKLSYTF